MADLWTVPNNYLLRNLVERVSLEEGDVPLPLIVSDDLEVEVISGKLPPGLRIENYHIVGTPFEVNKIERFAFVLRARTAQTFQDRTLQLFVNGPDSPIWITNEGQLPVGRNNSLFILDNEFIDFQLTAIDPDLPAGDELEYYIADRDGELPPGIELTSDGRLVGVVEPLLALDKRAGRGGYDTTPYGSYPLDWTIRSDNGFGTFFYDTQTFDFNYSTQSPKKLNRYYTFAVTVSDGVTEPAPRREFQIYVVGDDYLRSDNSIMKVSTGVFTADNTHIRTPRWITPGDLGYKRADNYITIYLDVYNDETLEGAVTYTLEQFNDDGTFSTLPPGTSLDNIRGEIVGRVPYQPRVTEEYKFTVRATRFTGDIDYATVTATVYEDTLLGRNKFKVYKLPLNVQDGITLNDGIDDLNQLRNQTLTINGKSYTVLSVDGTNEDYDVITLTETLTTNFFFKVKQTTTPEATGFFIERLDYFNKERWRGKNLILSDVERYQIQNVSSYREWQITSPSGKIDINLSAADLSPLPGGVTESRADKIRRIFGDQDNPVTVIVADSSNIRFIAKSRGDLFAEKAFIERVFVYNGTAEDDLTHTLVDDTRDRIQLDRPLEPGRVFSQFQTIGIAIEEDTVIEKTFVTDANQDVNNPFSIKTFTIKLLGEVDSVITWNSPEFLGSINANYISTFKIDAETSLPDGNLVYELVSGRLPNGLSLVYNGEIIGKATQFGTVDEPGLTVFDGGLTQFDENTTTIDRTYTFTVRAQDRFRYSAEEKTFTIRVIDQDDTLYSSLYMKPLLKPEVRNEYRLFINDPIVFPPDAIYRPNDPEFGIQKTPKMLAYAGIETKTLPEFVAATAKHHKRRRYKTGDVKKAIAKQPGTNDIVYEVIYLEVVDPAESTEGETRKTFTIRNQEKITADIMSYHDKDNRVNLGSGYPEVAVSGRFIDRKVPLENAESLSVETRSGDVVQNIDNRDVDIETRQGTEEHVDIQDSDSEPYKIRPAPANTIKADSNAVTINQQGDIVRYLSNTTNMREELEKIGKSQREYLPLWMRTGQDNTIQELDYVTAIPLAYCKPGRGDEVLLNVQNAVNTGSFDFKRIDLDIDRYVVDSAIGTVGEQYVIFANYQFNE